MIIGSAPGAEFPLALPILTASQRNNLNAAVAKAAALYRGTSKAAPIHRQIESPAGSADILNLAHPHSSGPRSLFAEGNKLGLMTKKA